MSSRVYVKPYLSYILVALVAVLSGMTIVQYMEESLTPTFLGIGAGDDEMEDVRDQVPVVNGQVEDVGETPGNWELVSGDMKDTCTAPIFSGKADIRGWLVYTETLGTKEWMFELVPDDQKKLPMHDIVAGGIDRNDVNRIVYLEDIPEDLVERVRVATSEKPVRITIRGYRLYCEGAPSLSFDEMLLAPDEGIEQQ